MSHVIPTIWSSGVQRARTPAPICYLVHGGVPIHLPHAAEGGDVWCRLTRQQNSYLSVNVSYGRQHRQNCEVREGSHLLLPCTEIFAVTCRLQPCVLRWHHTCINVSSCYSQLAVGRVTCQNIYSSSWVYLKIYLAHLCVADLFRLFFFFLLEIWTNDWETEKPKGEMNRQISWQAAKTQAVFATLDYQLLRKVKRLSWSSTISVHGTWNSVQQQTYRPDWGEKITWSGSFPLATRTFGNGRPQGGQLGASITCHALVTHLPTHSQTKHTKHFVGLPWHSEETGVSRALIFKLMSQCAEHSASHCLWNMWHTFIGEICDQHWS